MMMADFVRWPSLKRRLDVGQVILDGPRSARLASNNRLRFSPATTVRPILPAERALLNSLGAYQLPLLLVFDQDGRLRLTWKLTPDIDSRNMIVRSIRDLIEAGNAER